ncbi:MAG: ribonuclease III [Acidimicrobiia bacterium]
MESPRQADATPGSGIQERLGHRFDNTGLLIAALTHGSFVAEHPDTESYERLEFLGDAVIELAVTAMLFTLLGDESEGTLTKLRASVVDVNTLSDIARDLDLGDEIRLGRGERMSGGAERDSILSDVVEALIGAVYVDAGFDSARRVVHRLWSARIGRQVDKTEVTDPRSALQEHLARSGRAVSFAYTRSGPDHDAVFEAVAIVDGEPMSRGSGSSKKAAALAASAEALKEL